MADDRSGPDDEAAIVAVGAHGMLHSLSVAKATIATLRLHWGALDDGECRRMLDRADEHLTFLGDSLLDLIRGIPSEARAARDALDRRE